MNAVFSWVAGAGALTGVILTRIVAHSPRIEGAGRLAWVAWPAVLLPPAWILASFGDVPVGPCMDYWYMIEPFVRTGRVEAPFGEFSQRSNEHCVVVAKLVYVLNAAWTGSDSRVLFLVSFAMMAVTAWLAARAIRTDLGKDMPETLVIAAPLSIFLFAPIAAHNWLLGYSGVAWFSANALTAGAFAAQSAAQHGSRNAFALSLGLGAAAAFSYSTGLCALPAMAAAALVVHRNFRRTAMYLAASTAVMGFCGGHSNRAAIRTARRVPRTWQSS